MTRTAQQSRRAFRAIVLILALAALLGVSAAATSSAHIHLTSSSARCDLCFTAHLAAPGTGSPQLLHGPFIVSEAVTRFAYFGYQTPAFRPSLTRGPPSLS